MRLELQQKQKQILTEKMIQSVEILTDDFAGIKGICE